MLKGWRTIASTGGATFFVLISVIISAQLGLAESTDSFAGRLTPEKGALQRAVMPAIPPVGEFARYHYIGTYEKSSGESFDLYFDRDIHCKGEVDVSGKVVDYSFDNCKEPGQAKCAYSAKQLFVKSLKCVG